VPGVRSRLRRHTALLSLLAAAVLVAVVVASWTALRPTASEPDLLPEPIRVVEVPDPAPAPPPQLPAPPGPGPADVVPPPPLPDDDGDDGDEADDDGGGDDGGDDD
jgi:hypothetical protein